MAEAAAADYLKKQGYKVLEKNWRTKYCEIDIVAEKDKTVYFVEVKYRANAYQGQGLDYITSKKLNQMKFAAEFWITTHDPRQGYSLSALEVYGEAYEITEFLPEL